MLVNPILQLFLEFVFVNFMTIHQLLTQNIECPGNSAFMEEFELTRFLFLFTILEIALLLNDLYQTQFKYNKDKHTYHVCNVTQHETR